VYIKYGNFQFEPWEASLSSVSIQALYSPRRFKQTQIIQMTVTGDVVATGQYNVGTRLAQIRDAIAVDGKDFGLYHDNGTPTVHFLESNNPLNLTGNQIAGKFFPADEGAEYISGRQFGFVVKAEIDDAETPLTEYRDTIKATGDCGPIFRWDNTEAGLRVEKLTPNSYQHVIHEGFARTNVPWFFPPAPYYDRPFHLGHLREIAYIGPDRYPQGFKGYTTQWKYHYILPIDTFNTPTIR
jgi:hypothetical protein